MVRATHIHTSLPTEESLASAVAHVDQMGADLGGTEILTPLLKVLTTPAKPGVPRQLFVLTGAASAEACVSVGSVSV